MTPRLITVPGRVLTGPTVKYKDDKTANTSFGSWNMREVKFSMEITTSFVDIPLAVGPELARYVAK